MPDFPPLLRDRDAFARELVLPDGLCALDERLALPVDDLARLPVDFFAPLEREDAGFVDFDALLVERFAAGLRFEPVDDFRAPLERAVEPLDEDPELPPLDDDISALHLPDMTRCAASATASAMSEPNLVALAITLLAARSAVSAASSPASRIFLRAPGLAAIAAAAAVNPAASISLLIAAFASLSTVDLLDPERDALPLERDDVDPRDPPDFDLEELLREEVLRVDLAMFYLPRRAKDTLRPFRFPNEVRTVVRCKKSARRNVSRKCKGHRRVTQRCPSTWSAAGDVAVRQHVRAYEHPFPTSLLNHETSDHLLSLR